MKVETIDGVIKCYVMPKEIGKCICGSNIVKHGKYNGENCVKGFCNACGALLYDCEDYEFKEWKEVPW